VSWVKVWIGSGVWVLGLAPLGSPAFALEAAPACGGFTPPILRQMAHEYVLQELAGVRLSAGSACLQKLKLQWGKLEPDPVQESGQAPERIPDTTEVRIVSVRPVDRSAKPGSVTADFELKLKGRWVRDRLRFMLNWDPGVQREMGCTGLLESPGRWRVRQSCLK
jgi:hypothetical protein